ncbi:MAG: thiamine pyrophosphate-binding protein [Rhodoferax sp.]|nr:thiamine pyrophosphate-binding protein [Rhodoferax sp.]
MKTVAEQIADWLVRQGIEQVFTVTGGGAMFLNQALGSHPGLVSTFMHHEQACAMAAEGYARIAGKPAVVMLTTGPGSINAFNGVYGAFTDSIPMIVISGQVKRETCLSFHDLPGLRQLGDQEGPTVAMASSICKSATLIRNAAQVQTALPAAYALAISGRPGPVWLDIPLDIQSSKEALTISDPPAIEKTQAPKLEAACLEIIERLRRAHRPLILGGTGVRLAGAVGLLRQLVEDTGIPLATAWTHDLIASDHPLFAGRPGTIGTRSGNFCLQNADVVLVIGSRLNIRQTSYNWDSFGKNAWIVQVDVDAAELAKPGVQADLKVQADALAFIETLRRLFAQSTLPNFSAWGAWCREIGTRYHVRKEHTQKPGAPLNPYVVVDRIFRQMRDNDVAACGNASACILPFQMAHLTVNQRLFSNSGSASMGYDLPSAIGAACADNNKRRVICFAGDGSLQMNIQELQTLKTTGRNVIVVVINNAGYLSIWQTHENFFGRVIGATPASGVEFPDFESVAKAYGLKAATIRSEADLSRLDALLQEDGPLLLNVVVDPRQEFAPRIKSRVDENGQFVTPELDDMHPFLAPAELKAVADSARAIQASV